MKTYNQFINEDKDKSNLITVYVENGITQFFKTNKVEKAENQANNIIKRFYVESLVIFSNKKGFLLGEYKPSLDSYRIYDSQSEFVIKWYGVNCKYAKLAEQNSDLFFKYLTGLKGAYDDIISRMNFKVINNLKLNQKLWNELKIINPNIDFAADMGEMGF